jgi:hypothetical protein
VGVDSPLEDERRRQRRYRLLLVHCDLKRVVGHEPELVGELCGNERPGQAQTRERELFAFDQLAGCGLTRGASWGTAAAGWEEASLLAYEERRGVHGAAEVEGGSGRKKGLGVELLAVRKRSSRYKVEQLSKYHARRLDTAPVPPSPRIPLNRTVLHSQRYTTSSTSSGQRNCHVLGGRRSDARRRLSENESIFHLTSIFDPSTRSQRRIVYYD